MTHNEELIAKGRALAESGKYGIPPPPEQNPANYIPPNNTATPQHSSSAEVQRIAVLHRILDAVADEVRSRGLGRV